MFFYPISKVIAHRNQLTIIAQGDELLGVAWVRFMHLIESGPPHQIPEEILMRVRGGRRKRKREREGADGPDWAGRREGETGRAREKKETGQRPRKGKEKGKMGKEKGKGKRKRIFFAQKTRIIHSK